jgi:hypothetical protein
MKKEYIIGGLALLGAIGVVAYLLKPKAPRRNSEGFFGASGRMSRIAGGCRICASSPTSLSGYYAPNGYCRQGDYCRQSLKSVSQD